MSLRLQVQDWVEQNPLRRWRKGPSRLTIMQTAALVGVSSLAIQMWEAGNSTPRSEHMRALARLMDQPDLPFLWASWKQERPERERSEA